MGKVHEALKRAELDGNKARSSLLIDDARLRGAKSNGRKLDFIDYSLNAGDSSEIEERKREKTAAEAARKSLIEPSREISIDTKLIPPQLVTFHDPNTYAGEEYNKLAINLMTRASEQLLKRVLVASAQHGEGRTSIILNLACTLARAQRRVLVIDTDLHRPSLLRFLGLSAEVGLTDALSKDLRAGSAVLRLKPFGFDLLPTREQVKNPAELLTSASFGEMLELFEPNYDFILFDSPPLLTVADSSLLVRHTHAMVLVIRAGKTTSGQIGKAIAALTQDKILGVVLNRADYAA